MIRLPARATTLAYLALLALPCLSLASQRAASVTYDSSGKPFDTVISEIGEQIGQNWKVAGNLKDLPVVISVRDIDPTKLQQLIATVCSAEWIGAGPDKSLTRTPRTMAAASMQEVQIRTAIMLEAIRAELDQDIARQAWTVDYVRDQVEVERRRREEILKQISGAGSGGAVTIRTAGTPTGLNPALITAYQVLRNFPAANLATVLPGERVVYSSQPTAMQRPLPFRAESFMEQFRQAHNLLASVANDGRGTDPNISISGGLDLEAKPINGPLGKLLVIVQRMSGRDPGVSFEIKLADREGRIVGDTQLWLGPQAQVVTDKSESGLGSIELPDEIREMALVLSPTPAGSEQNVMRVAVDGDIVGLGGTPLLPKPMSSALQALLSDPVSNDPVRLLAEHLLVGIAKAKGKQLVASVPDQFASRVLPLARTGQVDLAAVFAQAAELGITIEAVDDVVTVSPSNPAEAIRTSTNRVALRHLIRTIMSQRYANLNDLASYAVAMPTQFDDRNVDMLLLGALHPMSAESLDGGPTQRQFLRLYGSLSPNQRLDQQQETLIPFGTMRPDQRQIVHSLAYGPTGMSIIGGGRGNKSMAMMMTMGDGPGDRPAPPSLAQEPTEALPNGVPMDSVIRLGRRVLEGLYGLLTGDGFGKFMTVGELGMNRGLAQSELGATGRVKVPEYRSYKMADITRIQISLLAGAFQKQADLSDGTIRQGSLAVRFEELPEGIRAAVQKAAEQASSMRFNFGGGPQRPPAS